MEPQSPGSILHDLSHPFDIHSDPVATAGELVQLVRGMAAVLAPVLGPRGVAALYQRALHVTRAQHPWLGELVDVAQPVIDLEALQAAFAHRPGAEAATVATALLQSFQDLLASLIGRPLSQRLLDPVWAHSPRRPTAQDPTP